MLENELAWRTEAEVRARLLEIWQVMRECVAAGIATEGVLPGGLKVRRRAPALPAPCGPRDGRRTARHASG